MTPRRAAMSEPTVAELVRRLDEIAARRCP